MTSKHQQIKNFIKKISYVFTNTNYRIKYNTLEIKSKVAKQDFAIINTNKDITILNQKKEIEKLKSYIKEVEKESEEGEK